MVSDLRPQLAEVKVPTLVIAAEADAIPLPYVRALTDYLEDAQFAWIRRASHFATFTAVDAFQRIVSTFLREGTLPQEAWEP